MKVKNYTRYFQKDDHRSNINKIILKVTYITKYKIYFKGII